MRNFFSDNLATEIGFCLNIRGQPEKRSLIFSTNRTNPLLFKTQQAMWRVISFAQWRSSFCRTYLSLGIIIDEMLFGEDEPPWLVVDRRKAFFVLGSFHHQTLLNDFFILIIASHRRLTIILQKQMGKLLLVDWRAFLHWRKCSWILEQRILLTPPRMPIGKGRDKRASLRQWLSVMISKVSNKYHVCPEI